MDEATRAALADIAREWDKAEQLMKLAERLRAEVVQPSVNELRYAGRRLVDALNIAYWAETDPTVRVKFDDYVADAIFRCHCAQHDAIDASVLFVQRALDEYEREFTIILLITHFPEVADLRHALAEADELIVSSRQQRGKRAEAYDRLAASQLPSIVLGFKRIASNRKALEALVADARKQERQAGRRFRWSNGTTIIAAVAGAVLAAFLTLALTGSTTSTTSAAKPSPHAASASPAAAPPGPSGRPHHS